MFTSLFEMYVSTIDTSAVLKRSVIVSYCIYCGIHNDYSILVIQWIKIIYFKAKIKSLVLNSQSMEKMHEAST